MLKRVVTPGKERPFRVISFRKHYQACYDHYRPANGLSETRQELPKTGTGVPIAVVAADQ